MFNVLLFQFAKKKNSTKRPDTGDGHIYTCELKNGTDIMQPVMIFNFGEDETTHQAFNPLHFTYARIAEFGRYYTIEDWTWANGLWLASMKIDCLATYKEEIGIQNLYVTRAASAYDRRVIDTKYPAIAGEETQDSVRQVSPWKIDIGNAPSVTDGFYILGIVNSDVNAIGTVGYYAFSEPSMRDFLNKLYNSPTWLNVTDASLSADLQKMLLNPMQYITSAMWIPYEMVNYSQSNLVTDLPIGWWSITLRYPAVRIKNGSLYASFYRDITIPKHPQSVPIGSEVMYRDWLNIAPYTSYALEFYPFGMIPLDSAKLLGASKLRLDVLLDYITGKGTLRVLKWQQASGQNSETLLDGAIYATTAQVGIPISISQMSVNLGALGQASTWLAGAGLGVATSETPFARGVRTAFVETYKGFRESGYTWWGAAIAAGKYAWNTAQNIRSGWSESELGQAAASGASARDLWEIGSNNLTESLTQTTTDIGNAVAAVAGTCQSQGATGAIAQYSLPIVLTAYFLKIAPTDNTNNGSPLCQKRVINTLSGFIQVMTASAIELYSTPAEAAIVKAYLESGFFYE